MHRLNNVSFRYGSSWLNAILTKRIGSTGSRPLSRARTGMAREDVRENDQAFSPGRAFVMGFGACAWEGAGPAVGALGMDTEAYTEEIAREGCVPCCGRGVSGAGLAATGL